jgi:predicted nucleic acid-binding protein
VSFLLDTNVISEIRRGRDPHVHAWAAAVDPAELYLSVLTVGEIRKGIETLRNRDPEQADVFANWLQLLHTRFADRILSVDARRRPVGSFQRATTSQHGRQPDRRDRRHLSVHRCHAQHARLRGLRRSSPESMEPRAHLIPHLLVSADRRIRIDSPGQAEHQHATACIFKGMPRYPVPVVILSRLAVDASVAGRGSAGGCYATR